MRHITITMELDIPEELTDIESLVKNGIIIPAKIYHNDHADYWKPFASDSTDDHSLATQLYNHHLEWKNICETIDMTVTDHGPKI